MNSELPPAETGFRYVLAVVADKLVALVGGGVIGVTGAFVIGTLNGLLGRILIGVVLSIFLVSYANHVLLGGASVGKRLTGLRLVNEEEGGTPARGALVRDWGRGLLFAVRAPLGFLSDARGDLFDMLVGEDRRSDLRVVRTRDLRAVHH
ncbi:RDD family protein [Sinosporangium siamense]|uniref:RDD domain-containing protein n=1 Tax=Sinosporangium siamense TaxID=1367973 RepID=A0A919RP41_9ACTN|nr:RDD family protein [Sinosporangium siamense]GII96044.1 hypothetical protein Ssi02_62750 [Sinosporangium siamense]